MSSPQQVSPHPETIIHNQSASLHFQRHQTLDEERLKRLQTAARVAICEQQFSEEHVAGLDTGIAIRRWAEEKAWRTCHMCGSLIPRVMMPSFSSRDARPVEKCVCESTCYHVPLHKEWPQELRGLTSSDQTILALYDLYVGSTSKKQHGYRCKDGGVAASLKTSTVSQRIQQISDLPQRQRLEKAFNVLVHDERSAYVTFVHDQEEGNLSHRLPFYHLFQIKYIETALWPLLYPWKHLCESSQTGGESHLSQKKSFMSKVFSPVVDYSMSFPLLRFQYDRWLYKTISGAIESGRISGCSPARALDSKIFSPTYWQWHHSCLIDAVRQFGPPNIFITVSPYEWTFPRPDWLKERMSMAGCGSTGIPLMKTVHIAHVLQELLRGYITGKSKHRWTNHLLRNMAQRQSNVKTYFYRFEFQQRGTLHVHFVAWLDRLDAVDIERFSADIPTSSRTFAELVYTTQKSKQPVCGLVTRAEPNKFQTSTQGTRMLLKRSEQAHALNLRPYIDTLLTSLRCSMDVQVANDNSLLLRYVTGYVSKYRDNSFPLSSLYEDISGRDAAYHYLSQLTPAEPEMAISLSSIKVAHTPSDTKRYIVPTRQRAHSDSTVEKYTQRPITAENMSLFDFLHKFTYSTRNVHERCSSQTVLVAVKTVNFTNDEYFFQDSLLHCPFRQLQDLTPAQADTIPDDLSNFAFAAKNRSALWRDRAAVQSLVMKEGNRWHIARTVVAFVQSYWMLWEKWTSNDIESSKLARGSLSQLSEPSLNPEQESIVHEVVHLLQHHVSSSSASTTTTAAIVGRQGTGKTSCLYKIINEAINDNLKVLVATPTGLLANMYSDKFGNYIDCETVHAAFYIAVSRSETSRINWNLCRYNMIIIDEISMISVCHGQHIIMTLSSLTKSPFLLVCGDDHQIQPVGGPSIFSNRRILATFTKFHLSRIERTRDIRLQQFLNKIRHWQPTREEVTRFAQDITLHFTTQPSNRDIINAYNERRKARFITFTNKGSEIINEVISNHLFQNNSPLLLTFCGDSSSEKTPIYAGMKIRLTENRQKSRGFVNGQEAIVDQMLGRTILVEKPNGQILRVFPVTAADGKVYYPFVRNYAFTIHKAQGHTFEQTTIWFDSRRLPAGCGYVAVSRARRRCDIRFLVPPTEHHFKPHWMQ